MSSPGDGSKSDRGSLGAIVRAYRVQASAPLTEGDIRYVSRTTEPSPVKETAESAGPSTNASNASTAAASGSAATTASVSAGVTNYSAVLQAWLQDHMRYPRRAKLRNM